MTTITMNPANTAAAATQPTADAQKQARLAAGAKDFEAMMLEQMLKPLHFGASGEDGADGEEASGAAGSVQGFATEALAKGVAAGGGVGFARQILREMSAQHESSSGTGPSTKV